MNMTVVLKVWKILPWAKIGSFPTILMRGAIVSLRCCQIIPVNWRIITLEEPRIMYGPVSNNLNYRDNLLGEIKPLQTDCWKFFHSVTNGNIVPSCHTAGVISCSVQWSNESLFDYALMHWIPKIWNIAFIARSCIADFCPFWKLLLKSLLTSLFYLTVEK